MEFIQHPGVRQVLERAVATYRQAPEKFDKLAGLLSSFVDLPELLITSDFNFGNWRQSSETQGELNDLEREKLLENEQLEGARLLQGCIKRLKENFLKDQGAKLSLEIKAQGIGSQNIGTETEIEDKLKHLMNVHRDRISLNK